MVDLVEWITSRKHKPLDYCSHILSLVPSESKLHVAEAAKLGHVPNHSKEGMNNKAVF